MAQKKKTPADIASTAFSKKHELVRVDNVTGYEERIRLLKSLRDSIFSKKTELETALNEDFDGRSVHETVLADFIPTISIINYSIKHLRKWMRPEKRHVALHFLPAKNRIMLQPKGVILIISPWNYPVSLSLLPLASALAAGNRVILKPSECTPKTSKVLAQIVRNALPSDRATILTGGPEISIELCKLPFDHILFTGSTTIGREVMKSAAQNLTPVTLELGGKSPAVIHEDYDLAQAALRIARGKLINAGQTCIAPDYALVPRARMDEFVGYFKNAIKKLYPQIEGNSDYSSIVNKRHFDRLNGLLKDAKNKGAKTIAVGPGGQKNSGKRKLHPHIVQDISTDMDIAHEEIFGPILSVIPYDGLEDASAYINQRPHPLALYYFDDNRARVQDFLGSTISGGAVVNDTVLHFVQDDLPFGGIGPSGMGVCHGFEGFKEFSHAKSIHYQAKLNGGSLIYPPYGKLFDWIARFLLRK